MESILKRAGLQSRADVRSSVAFCVISVALLTASAQITIPVLPVPFTLQTFVLYGILLLGTRGRAVTSVTSYLAIGAMGAPVFAGFKGGLLALAGPTGGFLVGFVVAAWAFYAVRGLLDMVGLQASAWKHVADLASGFAAMFVLFAFGWAWLIVIGEMTGQAAFAAAVAPFMVFDLGKLGAAFCLSRFVHVRRTR